jgi:3-oxosteroid 1-dehydrogenase
MSDDALPASVDWICIGSGASGCASAIAGHDRGMSVLVIEKADELGGMTAKSAGLVWAPRNHLMREAGLDDSTEAALDYLRYTGSDENDRDQMATFVEEVPRVVEFLHRQAGVEFQIAETSEFYRSSPGSLPRGRLLLCKPLAADTLGGWRSKVRMSPYYHSMSSALPGPDPGLGGSDGPHIGHSGPVRNDLTGLEPWKSHPDWSFLEAHLDDDEKHRVAGASLAAHLVRGVVQRNIDVRTGWRVEALCVEGGRVVGVAAERDGRSEQIRARRGVLVATNNDGDGWRLAAAAGAAVTPAVVRQGLLGLHVPGEVEPDGTPAVRANYELRMRHGIVINSSGERFGNEWFFQHIGAKLHAFDTYGAHRYANLPCYLVFDSALLETYSFAGRPPGWPAPDWLVRGDTLAELAGKLDVPPDTFQATVDRFNKFATGHQDDDFSREPSSLGTIDTPPYFAVRLLAPSVSTGVIGLISDTRGRLLHHRTSEPIPGLYASGPVVDTAPVLGVGYQAGCQLALALTFGVLAAEDAAGTVA